MEQKIIEKLKYINNKTLISLILMSVDKSYMSILSQYLNTYDIYKYSKEELSSLIINLYKKGVLNINNILNYYPEKDIIDNDVMDKYPFLKSMNSLEKECLINSGNFIYLTKINRGVSMKNSIVDLFNELKDIKKKSNLCAKCSLRNQPFVNIDISNVIGNEVDILFVGEAPGEDETVVGKPFVGKSGKLLRTYISSLGENISYCIANTCLCRPPNNRTPTPSEIENCIPNLFSVIETINPKLIVACGLTAYKGLTLRYKDKKQYEMKHVRGLTSKYKDIGIYTIYHPSYILRTNNKNLYDEDFSVLRNYISNNISNTPTQKISYQHSFKDVYKKIKYDYKDNLCFVKLDKKYYDTDKYRLLNIEKVDNYILYSFKNEKTKQTEYIAHEIPTYYYSSNKRRYFLDSSEAKLHLLKDDTTVQEFTYEKNLSPLIKCYNDYKLQIDDTEKVSSYTYCILDIEVLTYTEEFPDQRFSNYPISLVSIYSSHDNSIHTFVFDSENIYRDEEIDVRDTNDNVIGKYQVKYHYFSDEKEMILKVIEFIANHDITLAWNISFDIPYIYNRLKHFSLDPTLYFTKVTSLRPFINVDNAYISTPGMIMVDALNLYKVLTRTEGEKESYKLDYIASIELDSKKTSSGKFFYKLWEKSRSEACYYNQIDVCLTKLILDKYQAIEFNNKLRSVFGVNWNSIDSQSLGVESMLYYLSKSKKRVFIDREGDVDNTSYEGGFVHEPLKGVRYVSVYDFSSLYPSIIITLNIGNDTLRARIQNKRDLKKYIRYRLYHENGDQDIKVYFVDSNMREVLTTIKISEFHEVVKNYTFSFNGTFYSKEEKSLISELASLLKMHRDRYKKLYKETKDISYNSSQLVYKVGANSVYGYTGYKYSTLYDRNIAEAITKQGQILNKYCSMLYENDFQIDDNQIVDTIVSKYFGIDDNLDRKKVIYGDTDSIMITIPHNSDLNILTNELEMKFNNRLKDFAKNICNSENVEWKLSYEKSGYLYVVTKRRYALYKVHPGNESMIIKGLEVRKVNYPNFLKEKYVNILYMLLRDRLPVDEINEYIREVEREYRSKYKELDMSVGVPVIWMSDKKQYKVSNPGIKGMLLYNSLIRNVFQPGSRGYQFDIRFNPLTSEMRTVIVEYLKSLKDVVEKVNLEKESKEIRSIVIPYDITEEDMKKISELIKNKILLPAPDQAIRTFWNGKLEDFGLSL